MMALWIGFGLLSTGFLWVLALAYRCICQERRAFRKMAPLLKVPRNESAAGEITENA